MKDKPIDEPLTCIKCGRASVTIRVTADGMRGETASYGADCRAGCGLVMDQLPSNCNGRKATAIAEYKRELKKGTKPASSTPIVTYPNSLSQPPKVAAPTASLSELRKDVYVRILLARNAGTGVRLTADEVQALADDSAIHGAAEALLDGHGYMLTSDGIVPNRSK
ncbi:hypothetical protein PQR05_29810 [Paraburkholderia sediminicola]|uniref:hypothetical protein n=1 Tax=Paraburkholderia sediminicola TaxID=458836 RepID=UPI0038B7BDD8